MVCEGVVVADVEELVLELSFSVLLLLDVEFADVLFDVLLVVLFSLLFCKLLLVVALLVVVLFVLLFCELPLVDELVVVVFPELLFVALPSFFDGVCV